MMAQSLERRNNSREVNAENQQVETKELSKRRRISELSRDLWARFLLLNWSLERLQSDKYQQTAPQYSF